MYNFFSWLYAYLFLDLLLDYKQSKPKQSVVFHEIHINQ